MRILINDSFESEELYKNTFLSNGYEHNELLFVHSYAETREFVENQLEKKKLHIDIIITNDSSYKSYDVFKAYQLQKLVASNINSHSQTNFRICSIPVILYSDQETNTIYQGKDFAATIEKNSSGNHVRFVAKVESVMKSWRTSLFDDLDKIGLPFSELQNVNNFNIRNRYLKHVRKREEELFIRTKILSLEFIKYPQWLNYDWLNLTPYELEMMIDSYGAMYRNHLKYDRKNNERTIIHQFFLRNKPLLLRGSHNDLLYEKNLYEKDSINSEECDFILQTDCPEYANTTFFEVKKEDVKLLKNKKRKRPSISAELHDHLGQLYSYKKYTMNSDNYSELESKIGYQTSKFNFVLLAGREDEKEGLEELFSSEVSRMYPELVLYTFEDLEKLNFNYHSLIDRLKVS